MPKSGNDHPVDSTRYSARRLLWIILPILILVIGIVAVATGPGETPKAGWICVGIGVFGIASRIWIYALITRTPPKERK